MLLPPSILFGTNECRKFQNMASDLSYMTILFAHLYDKMGVKMSHFYPLRKDEEIHSIHV